jgi:hypothetical protein
VVPAKLPQRVSWDVGGDAGSGGAGDPELPSSVLWVTMSEIAADAELYERVAPELLRSPLLL